MLRQRLAATRHRFFQVTFFIGCEVRASCLVMPFAGAADFCHRQVRNGLSLSDTSDCIATRRRVGPVATEGSWCSASNPTGVAGTRAPVQQLDKSTPIRHEPLGRFFSALAFDFCSCFVDCCFLLLFLSFLPPLSPISPSFPRRQDLGVRPRIPSQLLKLARKRISRRV
jgi:hypothetical protein